MQFSKHFDLCSVGFTTGASSVVEVDMAEADGCVFVGVPCSTAARTWSLALKAGNSTSSFVNCSSTFTHSSTAANVNVIVTDVAAVSRRYLGATFSSTTATPCWLLAMKYNHRVLPTTFSATANVPVATSGVKFVVNPTSST